MTMPATDPVIAAADEILELLVGDLPNDALSAAMDKVLADAQAAGVRGSRTLAGLDPVEQAGVAAVLARSGYPTVTR